MIRSLLFVPADSEKKLARAASAGADAIVLDLEDSVLPERKPQARQMAREHLAARADRSGCWVRVNALSSGELLQDLSAIVGARPAGILLPKIRGPEDVSVVRHYLDAMEAACGVESQSVTLALVATETPLAVLRLGELAAQPQPRLRALLWGAEDLSAEIGAADPRTAAGQWRPMYEGVRAQCVFAAHALGVEAIDTVYVDIKDPAGLRQSCQDARHDGFTGKIAIHPDQVAVINEAFTPSAAELEHARRIVAAFESGAGAVSIDGKMYDIPHLKAARRLLGITTPAR